MMPPIITRPVGALRAVLRARPTCEHRTDGRRYCPRIATTVVPADTGHPDPVRNMSPRCLRHAPPDALRLCLSCRNPNRSADEWHCGSCQSADDAEPAE